jgi:hypothetical protein
MKPKLKSSLLTGGLAVFLLLITLSFALLFVSGPAEKQRRDRINAFKRVSMDYQILNPTYLYDSVFDRSSIIGEGMFEGVKVYFACDSLGRVLDRIPKDEVDFQAALALASKSTKFENPILRVVYFKGDFVIDILEKKRETILNLRDYSVVLTVETGV